MEWFIIQDGDHSGPYRESELHALIQSSTYGGQTQIWNETLSNPISYHTHFGPDYFELPPELPEEIKTKYAIENTDFSDEAMITDEDFTDEIHIDCELTQSEAVENEAKLPVKKRKYRYLFFALTFISLLGALAFWTLSPKSFHRPAGMTLSDYNKLSELAKSDVRSINFLFSISHDKKRVWAATNLPYHGDLLFNFHSLENKTLGGATEFEATGYLRDGLVELNDYRFLKSTSVIDGRYRVEIKNSTKLDKGFDRSIFSRLPQDLDYTGEHLLSSLSESAFESALSKFIKKKNSNHNNFFVELKEKYRTISVITEQIKEALHELFSKEKQDWGRNLALFEGQYKTQYGVFFTSFVSANELSYSSLVKKDFEDKYKVISHYSKLSKLAKSIGGVTMNTLGTLDQMNINKVTDSEMKKVYDQAMGALELIIIECKDRIEALDN